MVNPASLRKALSLGPPKEAALYFERVLPFDGAESMFKAVGLDKREVDPNGIPFDHRTGWNVEVLQSLLGDREDALRYVEHALLSWLFVTLKHASENPDVFDDFSPEDYEFIKNQSERAFNFDFGQAFDEARSRTFDYGKHRPLLTTAIGRWLNSVGYDDAPLWKVAAERDTGKRTAVKPSLENTYVATVKGLDLIDPDGIPWETVLELRRDPEAMAELRAFRLFFTETYDGHDTEAIKDRILLLHDRQKAVAKIWGMTLKERAFSVMLEAKTVGATSVASLAMAAVGGPVAAAAGSIIPLGRAALEVYKTTIDKKKEELDRPVRYLSRLEEIIVEFSGIGPSVGAERRR